MVVGRTRVVVGRTRRSAGRTRVVAGRAGDSQSSVQSLVGSDPGFSQRENLTHRLVSREPRRRFNAFRDCSAADLKQWLITTASSVCRAEDVRMDTGLDTKVDEIAAGIFRLSTWVPEIAPTGGFTFNQFLSTGDEPLLFHTGMRELFPLVSEAVARVMPLETLRWIALRPRRGRRVRRDEPVPRRGARRPRSIHGALGVHAVAERHVRPAAPVAGRRRGRSTSAGTGCGSSPRRTSRTTGRPGCGSTRRPSRCSPATCSPTSATARR